MDNQTQNIKPDYNFILSQQSPTPPKKKMDKRVVVIFASLAVLVVVVIISVVSRVSNSVTNAPGTATNSVTPVNSFFDAAKKKDYNLAAKTSSPFQKNTNQLAIAWKDTFKYIDPASCTSKEKAGSNPTKTVTATCLSYDKRLNMELTFMVGTVQDKAVILDYGIKYAFVG